VNRIIFSDQNNTSSSPNVSNLNLSNSDMIGSSQPVSNSLDFLQTSQNPQNHSASMNSQPQNSIPQQQSNPYQPQISNPQPYSNPTLPQQTNFQNVSQSQNSQFNPYNPPNMVSNYINNYYAPHVQPISSVYNQQPLPSYNYPGSYQPYPNYPANQMGYTQPAFNPYQNPQYNPYNQYYSSQPAVS